MRSRGGGIHHGRIEHTCQLESIVAHPERSWTTLEDAREVEHRHESVGALNL